MCPCGFTHRFEVYDGAVGHDCVVSLHQVQLAAAVLGRLVQAVDRAALGAGADGHAGDGLIAADTVHRSCPTSARLQLLEHREREAARERERTRKRTRDTDRHAYKPTCLVIL